MIFTRSIRIVQRGVMLVCHPKLALPATVRKLTVSRDNNRQLLGPMARTSATVTAVAHERVLRPHVHTLSRGLSSTSRPFRVLGLQQVAVGAESKDDMRRIWQVPSALYRDCMQLTLTLTSVIRECDTIDRCLLARLRKYHTGLVVFWCS